MLGRKNYTQDELDQAKAAVTEQLAAYRRLVTSVAMDPKATAALEEFEPLFLNAMTLALDRFFVHRVRLVTGKDGNPLNEVELLAESLTNHRGVQQGSNVIKLVPAESITKVAVGDKIRLDLDHFERLCDAFFAELEQRFVQPE